MQYAGEQLVFSPSDLVVFMDGDFAAWMDRWYLEVKNGRPGMATSTGLPLGVELSGLSCAPDEQDAEMLLVAAKGQQFERTYLAELKANGCEVVEIESCLLDSEKIGRTIAAMRSGASYIYQARLVAGQFAGFADFLVRQSGDSELGDYHYEAWDTKLARSIKPYFVIQLSAYSALLEEIQGRAPDAFCIVLGHGEVVRRLVRKFTYYFRSFQRSFLEFQHGFSPDDFPNPGDCSNHGRWSTFASSYLVAADHLSRVANITQAQIGKLEAAGIRSFTALATTKKKYVPHLTRSVFERLKCQARLQFASRGEEKPLYEVQPADLENPRRGLPSLPPASPADIYFDMEGFPLVEGGLEYLFGAAYAECGERCFRDWWAHNTEQERLALEGFVDWVYDRWQSNPTLHIYHFAAYEVNALRRLMGKFATRERQIDELLRNHVFIDLFTIVRQGLVIGTTGYSLKDIECLYMGPRAGAVKTAGGSVVAYHAWLESGESEDWGESAILKEIRDYNRLDCDSTWQLAEWLRARQLENGLRYLPAALPEVQETEDDGHPATVLAEQLFQQLRDGSEADPERCRVQELLAYLLEYHWREAKPVFWAMFARSEMTEQELIGDYDCLGGLERTKTPPRPIKRSFGYEYRFDPEQDTKLHQSSKCFLAGDLAVRTSIEQFDAERGCVEIKLGPGKAPPPDRLALIPDEYVGAGVIADAVFRYVDAWSRGAIRSTAVDDLLHRRRPQLKHDGRAVDIAVTTHHSILAVVRAMQHTVLCVQGPPGCGKTYTAAQAILGLLADGKRIAVTANSHQAILNLLSAVHQACRTAGRTDRLIKVGEAAGDPLVTAGDIQLCKSLKDLPGILGTEPAVVGGTAWVFSRADLEGVFDYLFVDEAGQFSLANTVAVGLAAKNLVLVGDQMQLAQPTLGTHPGDSGQSALNYLLAGHATIPPELGVFLDETWRLHPKICRFISDAVYDGRLKSRPHTVHQRIIGPGNLITKPAGIQFIAVPHQGNSQCCEEETDIVERLVRELMSGQVYEREAAPPRQLTLNDILIVAPFNMQVRMLQKKLGAAARVGSVDKFQGQEAHVVIISMCSSTLEDSPRGAEFLLEPNRLNVAVSRAKTLAIVVGNPALVAARCQTIREMELANLFCWLVDYAQSG